MISGHPVESDAMQAVRMGSSRLRLWRRIENPREPHIDSSVALRGRSAARLNPEETDRETGCGLLNPERIGIVCGRFIQNERALS